MFSYLNTLRNLYLPKSKGQGLVEYAILVIIVVAIAIAAVALFGTAVQSLFTALETKIGGAI